MSRYADITSSSGEIHRQRRSGSQVDYGVQLEDGRSGVPDPLETREVAFLRKAESFFLATVTPAGWPYVQHRGGPQGFVHVLDRHTIGFVDFAGNRQYVTAGNLGANPKVAMFFIDYPLRQRLKVFGVATIHLPDEYPDLTTKLLTIGDRVIRSRIEQVVVIDVEAYNWNCSSHIKPLYDKTRLDEAIALERNAKMEEIDELQRLLLDLRTENDTLKRQAESKVPPIL